MTNADNYRINQAIIWSAIRQLKKYFDSLPAPEFASMSDARDAAQLAQALDRLTANMEVQS